MKTIAIIPARGGSKRLPHKNILPLGGVPLIAHTIAFAKANSAILDAIYVSTDDDKIASVAKEYGAQVIKRPAALSGDYEPTISAIQHVLSVIEPTVDVVVLLQATNPYRPKNLLEKAMNSFQSSGVDSLMTVSKILAKLGALKNRKYVPYNYKFGQRSQDIEPLYEENGLLYITKASCIAKGLILAENNTTHVIDASFPIIDIDTELDYKYAQTLF